MLSAYLQKILFGIALVATAPSIACAAEIEVVEEELCDIRITGEIVPGDAQRFVAALESARGARLCLNSRGGALQEAILIAEEVLRPFRVTTILEENSECLSACALIFMMGQTKEYDGITVFSRFMHHTATLGFHRPQVRFNFNGALDEESIISAFDTALDAVLEFLVLSTASNASSGDFIETDLLAQIDLPP